MHQREHIVVIRPRAHGLTLHTMFYVNEIRQVAEYGQTDKAELKDQEKKLALQLIESLAAPFQPEKYRDQYSENLRAMITAKQQGQEVAAAAHPKLAPVIDLMEALKKSLAEKKAPPTKQLPLRAVPPAASAASSAQKKTGKKSSTG
jgi:DNA end-binding protein Ku